MAQVLGFLSPTWDSRMKFPVQVTHVELAWSNPQILEE